jgi:hypothetical protein
MTKKVVVFLILIFVLIFHPKTALAQGEFIVDVVVNYDVQENGITKVTHTITLTNAISNLYAKSYLLKLENITPQNVFALEKGRRLELTKKKEKGGILLEVTFDNAVVGKGKSRTFTINFEEDSFATRTGEVWEVSIPRLSNSDWFRSYTVHLKVPTSFGEKAYISPNPLSVSYEDGRRVYTFNKSLVQKTGISAGFGEFQVFSFTLNYHLENPLRKTARTEIALPPDTAFQKVFYQSINPEPENIKIDEDGNWLATYTLKPRERVNITVLGSVQIFANPINFFYPSANQLSSNLSESFYWQVNDPQIKNLAKKLKTPKAIYDFVVNNLEYDYARVQPNVTRFGAKKALNNPDEAICMEFTDLFIALARAAGIPAREINGYAYTENPEIQPLSLVADVLHSWPEYWDPERNVWIPVDPTWGSTTQGIDFFNKLDLRHFTFVIHGKDPQKPYPPGSYKLGPNPQKDVFVSFGQTPTKRESKPEISAKIKGGLPFVDSKILITIRNPGPVALYDLTPTVFFDNLKKDQTTISVLPPYASYQMISSIPFSFLGTKSPDKIIISAAQSAIEVTSNKFEVILYNLVAIFLVLVLIIFALYLKYAKKGLTTFRH